MVIFKVRKPLTRSIAYSDESPCGLLLRASESNGWKSPNAFISAYGVHSSKKTYSLLSLITNKNHWNKVCEMLGVIDRVKCYEKMKVAQGSKYDFQGIQVLYRSLTLKEPSICPDCVNEKEYILGIWDHKLITACTTHNFKLINICPECKEELRWSRKGVSTCSCGHKLNTLKSSQIDTEVTQYIEETIKKKDTPTLDLIFQFFEVFELFFNNINIVVDNHQLAVFAGEALLNKQKVIKLLCKYVKQVAQSYGLHPRLTLFPFLRSSRQEIKELATSVLNKLSKLKFSIGQKLNTVDFPVDIFSAGKALDISPFLVKQLIRHSLLETKQRRKHKNKTIILSSINELLLMFTSATKPDTTYETLASLIIYNPSNEITLVNLINYIKENKTTFSGVKVSSGILSARVCIKAFKDKKHSYLTLRDVANICGVHSESIRYAVKCDVLKRIDPQKTKGTALYIEEKTALNFNKKYVFAGKIAKENNCSQSTTLAMKLIASGITPVSGPDVDNGISYLFKRSDILSLNMDKVIKMKNYPTKTGRKKKNQKTIKFKEQGISLFTVAHQLGVSIPKTASLMKKGFLIESENKSRNISITKASFESVKNIQEDTTLVTLQKASKSVHENKTTFLKHWVKTQFITLIDNGLDRYISRKDFTKIKKFKKKYVTSKEAGLITNTHRTHMLNLEKQNLIKPAKYLVSGKQKINLYNRKQVLEICK